MSTQPKCEFITVKIEKTVDSTIWTLFIQHPPANALTSDLISEMHKAILLFQADDFARAMILTAQGERFFCSGADINRILAISSPEQGAELAQEGQRLCDAIEQCDKPVIAAINGLCIGGGNEIAIACHMRIASTRAKFSQPEINLGIIPAFGATQRLPKLIGPSKARKMMLTGDIIAAQDAVTIGLVDLVVQPEKLLDSAFFLIKKILKNSQICITSIQRAVRDGKNLQHSAGMELEIDCFKKVCESEDMKEGLLAFKEKRVPNYRNKKAENQ